MKVRIALLALVGLWLVGEVALIPLAEGRVESRVADANREAATVDADIGPFPLAARVLATGRVGRLTVTLDQVARQRLTFAEVRFELEGIHVDRAAMVRGQARVTAIEGGTASITIPVGALGRITSFIGIQPRIEGRTLLAGPLSVQLPSDLLPCEPQVQVEEDRMVASCTIHDVPEPLIEALQARIDG